MSVRGERGKNKVLLLLLCSTRRVVVACHITTTAMHAHFTVLLLCPFPMQSILPSSTAAAAASIVDNEYFHLTDTAFGDDDLLSFSQVFDLGNACRPTKLLDIVSA